MGTYLAISVGVSRAAIEPTPSVGIDGARLLVLVHDKCVATGLAQVLKIVERHGETLGRTDGLVVGYVW